MNHLQRGGFFFNLKKKKNFFYILLQHLQDKQTDQTIRELGLPCNRTLPSSYKILLKRGEPLSVSALLRYWL